MYPCNRSAWLLGVMLVCGPAFGTSLYEEKTFQPLHGDKRAFAVGDGLTILVYQSVQANSSAGEGSQGDFKFGGTAGVDERRWGADVSLGSSNNADAATNRNGFVRAQLTVVVTAVDDNGTLMVSGKQTITVNEEEQTIEVVGGVRPEDVNNMNTVPSYRIQNARISIEGQGEVTAGKNGNVFTRLVNWMGF